MKTLTSSPAMTPRFLVVKQARPAITTTLYDLMAALQKQVDPEHEHVITAIVAYLLRTGQITFPSFPKTQVVV